MAQFELPPKETPEPRPGDDAPAPGSKQVRPPYIPVHLRYQQERSGIDAQWVPRIVAFVILLIVGIAYVTCRRKGIWPIGHPFVPVVFVGVAFWQWAPVRSASAGNLLVTLGAVIAAGVWLAASHFEW